MSRTSGKKVCCFAAWRRVASAGPRGIDLQSGSDRLYALRHRPASAGQRCILISQSGRIPASAAGPADQPRRATRRGRPMTCRPRGTRDVTHDGDVAEGSPERADWLVHSAAALWLAERLRAWRGSLNSASRHGTAGLGASLSGDARRCHGAALRDSAMKRGELKVELERRCAPRLHGPSPKDWRGGVAASRRVASRRLL